jgi:hypothetical protein
MEMLDQQITSALPVTEQRLHLGKRRGVDLPALRLIGPTPAARTWVDAPIVLYGRLHDVAA